MKQLRLGRVSEDTIRNALLYIRAECLRDGAPGLAEVDELLRLRGHEVAHVPVKTERLFKRGKLRIAVLAALRDGPKTGPQIAAHIAEAEGLPYRTVYKRLYQCLHTLKESETVSREKDRMRRYVWKIR
ncbi:helix-turn-helix transcriptional regulator [Profundibacterium mesophilum]|uniref:Precorrin-2 dehydrogenase n=1 Tax=Profundibacterium mesophilum KAUST100406-0324 TaxID=1037889 RepID=A0A921NPJ1_9RHOB|nr:helix-turn-helix transcriptional regulator [Profundibacterium mesophilum]KAF0675472.1 precorrin-2 dehydrogenase [Profundibacterium mesophilum KAUST100406-0324]